MAAIGIDLGTTNSCVAVVRDGQVEMVHNERGAFITPSCVAFHDDKISLGEAAKYKLTDGQSDGNIIYSVKRIIGKKFDENHVKDQGWNFKVLKDIDGMSTIEVLRSGKKETFRPEEISALVLQEMKMIAERALERRVQDAVIAVPAKFTILQRIETEAAAKIAGLNVIGMINEPTAAALACGISQARRFLFFPATRHVLVYDLGGGTFDVVVIEIKSSNFNVIGHAGDLCLGGNDFTENLAKDWQRKLYGLTDDSSAENDENKQYLWGRAEKAKKELSFEPDIRTELRNSCKNICETVKRDRLDNLNMDLYLKTMKYVDEALEQAGLKKEKIQDVVLAGGSTRIPFIRDLVKFNFPKEEIHDNLNPDEIVARGAAIYAAQLSGFATRHMVKPKCVETLTSSIRTNANADETSIIIEKKSRLPIEAIRTYASEQDNQRSIQILICQGEEERFSQNEFIDELNLPIRPDEAGKVTVEVKFKLDRCGILSATAREKRLIAKEKKVDMNLCDALRDRVKKQKKRLERIMKERK